MAEPSLIFLDKALKVTGRFSAFSPELISLEDAFVGIKGNLMTLVKLFHIY